MAKKSTKKSRRSKKKKKGWTSKLVTLASFLLFLAVLLLIVSTVLRWILPPEGDPVFGRNVIRVEVLNGAHRIRFDPFKDIQIDLLEKDFTLAQMD